ncbi:MAG: YebC/PmpR family DNA-binding transcriptional regulator [Endomicrobia bacterium]|nr:YebC/PmpR family DNA-binding transcriptional regulator [Endomicrobiia bacterium]MCX7940187.1 YebC/PmpR family DNA-binding transcriptional regulator [Endomicrobiia bacterium]MDW8055708.1 YebC/PmpR family DNA-binding transcriptional regulator [Elusimicrobiota bacterium]
MSGHSKWAGIKHRKMAQDAKRGKLFTRIIRELTIAAREGGGNPENNPRLRKAIEMAKEANMPQDNIKKAIMRGTGEIPGVVYEEVVYEGYGPGGVAVMVEVTTDNKNRTTSELRKIFSQYGGSLGETGCVSWIFEQKGYITVNKQDANEDDLMSIALELGAEDFKSDDENVYEIITSPQSFDQIKQELQNRYKLQQAEITMLPKTYIKLEGKQAEQVMQLMDALEDHEDVKNVYANFDIPDEILAKMEAQ